MQLKLHLHLRPHLRLRLRPADPNDEYKLSEAVTLATVNQNL